jgi:hypothetical protein
MQFKIENRQQWLTAIAVGIVALLAADQLILSPMAHGWRERTQRIAVLKESIDNGRRLLERAEGMESRWDRMLNRDLDLNMSVAENQLLRSVALWARESGVTFTSLLPQWKDDDQTLECRATVSGDLRAISRLLFALEKDPLSVRLDECELSTRDERGQELNLTLRFSAMRLPENKEGA